MCTYCSLPGLNVLVKISSPLPALVIWGRGTRHSSKYPRPPNRYAWHKLSSAPGRASKSVRKFAPPTGTFTPGSGAERRVMGFLGPSYNSRSNVPRSKAPPKHFCFHSPLWLLHEEEAPPCPYCFSSPQTSVKRPPKKDLLSSLSTPTTKQNGARKR